VVCTGSQRCNHFALILSSVANQWGGRGITGQPHSTTRPTTNPRPSSSAITLCHRGGRDGAADRVVAVAVVTTAAAAAVVVLRVTESPWHNAPTCAAANKHASENASAGPARRTPSVHDDNDAKNNINIGSGADEPQVSGGVVLTKVTLHTPKGKGALLPTRLRSVRATRWPY
jgi:hypothetical protein